MKVNCSLCARVAFGSEDSLTEEGWTHAEGEINNNSYNSSWCKDCFEPQMVEQLLIKTMNQKVKK